MVVRLSVTKNPATPPEELAVLSNDTASCVSESTAANLKERRYPFEVPAANATMSRWLPTAPVWATTG